MKRKRMYRDALGLTTTGMVLGVGASVPGGAAAVQPFSAMLPTVGTAMGARYSLDALSGLQPRKKHRR